jgi:uncharacterized membrane protein
MLYEIFWLVFALMVGILVSLGLLGLIFSPSLSIKPIKITGIVISGLILFTGIYFSYRWNVEKKGIQTLIGQIEQTIKTYQEKNKKDS